MFARRSVVHRLDKDEAEKPFWISFADLMIVSMVVFLIVSTVTIVVMKTQLDMLGDNGRKTHERQIDIERFANMIKQKSQEISPVPIISTIKDTIRIDLGQSVNFVSGSADLSDDGKKFLRAYIPKLLEVAGTDLGKKWLKHVVVEGFTDSDGSYLFNLDLSLKRSRGVVCAMFEPVDELGTTEMSKEDLNQIRDLFLVGGYSFNSMQPSKARSRRVELRLDFWEIEEKERERLRTDLSDKEFGKCL